MPIDPKIQQPARTMLGQAMRHELTELAVHSGDVAGVRLSQVPVRREAAGAAPLPSPPSAGRTGHCSR
jgi:hypothetical protein